MNEQLPFLHVIRVLHVHGRNEAVDPRADGVRVPFHKGVVGVLVAAEIDEQPDARGDQNDESDDDAHGCQGMFANPAADALFDGWLLVFVLFAFLTLLFFVFVLAAAVLALLLVSSFFVPALLLVVSAAVLLCLFFFFAQLVEFRAKA